MPVDTVRLSYDLRDWGQRFVARWRLKGAPGIYDFVDYLTASGELREKSDGRKGVCNYSVLVPGVNGQEGYTPTLTLKVVNNGPRVLMWEQSVPKYLNVKGPCPAEAVRQVDAVIRRLNGLGALPAPFIRRLDCTMDVPDPDGRLRQAAVGWTPHSRARYVQAIYGDPASLETVWLHNKSRGVRVYDKHAECGEDWAEGLTRVEYQVRGDWLVKLGLDRLHSHTEDNSVRAIRPLVDELVERRDGVLA